MSKNTEKTLEEIKQGYCDMLELKESNLDNVLIENIKFRMYVIKHGYKNVGGYGDVGSLRNSLDALYMGQVKAVKSLVQNMVDLGDRPDREVVSKLLLEAIEEKNLLIDGYSFLDKI